VAEYRTKTGRLLSDEDIRLLSEEAEKGYDVERLREAPRRPRRPQRYNIEDAEFSADEYRWRPELDD
jgi:hypothetical protein